MGTKRNRNENLWYILMTLYGEQGSDKIAWDLAEDNRKAWNAWISQALTDGEKNDYATRLGLDVAEFRPSAANLEAIAERFAERAGDATVPKPQERAHLNGLALTRCLSCSRFLFLDVTFVGSEFHEEADFSGALFAGQFLMGDGPARSSIDFTAAQFDGFTSFRKMSFGGEAFFNSSRFRGEVGFIGAEFAKHAYFTKASFGMITRFSRASFAAPVSFFKCQFGSAGYPATEVSFANAELAAPVSFERARFPFVLPVLSNTTLPESSKFTVSSECWPMLKPSVFGRLLRYLQFGPEKYATQKPETVKASAATLRHAMSRQMLPEEEHFFFRQEMWGAARSGPVMARPLIWLFGAVSNYGHSVGRPSLCLGALWLVGFATFRNQSYADNLILGSWEAAFFSFANMFKFFGLLGTYFDGVAGGFPERIQVLAGAQTVLAFILLFFLGLGLRTRFRLR